MAMLQTLNLDSKVQVLVGAQPQPWQYFPKALMVDALDF